MPQWAWVLLLVSVGLFALLVIPTMVYIIVHGVRLWRRVTAVEDSVGMPLEQLLFELETISVRAEMAAQRQVELERRVAELQDAIEKVRVLSWAVADARESVGVWRTITRR